MLSEPIYDELPLGALMSLWAMWPDRRHLVHARLLLAGHPYGAEGIDTYDVACLMWLAVEDEGGFNNPWAKPEDVRQARAKLREDLMGMQARPGSTRSEMDEFRALLNRNAEAPSETPPS